MRKRLTAGFVARPPAPEKGDRVIYWDTELRGFGLMVTAGGHRSYVTQYRAGRRSRRMRLKGGLNLSEARKEAKAVLGRVAKGGDPLTERRKAAMASSNTLASIIIEYLVRKGGKLRSIEQRRSVLERLVIPRLGTYQIDEIKRSDIVRLLDKIEDENGPVAADMALAFLSLIFTWHAGRSDSFKSPIVKGMRRTSAKERQRSRILDDDELRRVWGAAQAMGGPTGAFIRFLLLTTARRTEAAGMRWSELSGRDWLLPAARNKTKQDLIRPLSDAALDALADVPRIDGCEFVFSYGRRPLSNFSRMKHELDERSGVTGWTLHDLRRSGRSLMSRAGVLSDHAEHVLGHALPSIRGTYDRHDYYREKQLALAALAAQITRIVNPPADNVMPLVRNPASAEQRRGRPRRPSGST